MNAKLRLLIIGATALLGFLLGYNISSSTGNEPGYFESTEAGAYGVAEISKSPTGMSTDESDYYKSLRNE